MSVENKDFAENVREEERKFESSSQKLLQEIGAESGVRSDTAKATMAEILDKIAFVQGEIYSERKNREDSYDAMIKRIGNEILRVNDLILQERRQRETVYGDYMKLLNEIYARFNEELAVSSPDREQPAQEPPEHAPAAVGGDVFAGRAQHPGLAAACLT